MQAWEPTASLEQLQLYATVVQNIREYLHGEGLLEVVTPTLSRFANTDPHIESLVSKVDGDARYLHTSPEFPMKRLLAAHRTSIYQIAKVFRDGELGARHNAEFTLLEWYRVGYDHHQLMKDVDALIVQLHTSVGKNLEPTVTLSYVGEVQTLLGLNFNEIRVADIQQFFSNANRSFPETITELDEALTLLVDEFVVREFAQNRITFLTEYPATQASLARIAKTDASIDVAERFEAFIGSVELANGFHELANGAEQQQRFEQDNALRLSRGQTTMPIDVHLIAALNNGFPDCAGVALGVDRLCMVLSGVENIRDVQSFGSHNA